MYRVLFQVVYLKMVEQKSEIDLFSGSLIVVILVGFLRCAQGLMKYTTLTTLPILFFYLILANCYVMASFLRYLNINLWQPGYET